MKTKLTRLMVALSVLALPALVQAQFTFTTNNGAITITGYNTAAGLDVVIPAMTNGYPVTSVGDYAFENEANITSVTIPNSVTNIGVHVFEYCSSLTNVTIPNSITSIGVLAFAACTSLTSVTIPANVTSIGSFAFDSCTSLTSITVDASNPAYSSQGGVLFDKAQTTLLEFPCGLGGSYTIPNSVTSIGGDAFVFCSRLTSMTIPNSVTSIGVEAFAETSLTSVTIPNSVTLVGSYAFYYCLQLTNVTIGNSVTSIGGGAFFQCISLTSVHFTGNAPSPTNDSTVFSGDPATVYYLPGTTGWGTMFDGRPTAPWFLPNPQILNNGPGFGVQSGGFGFTISWATNVFVVVEAATNLANPVWIPVSTNPLTGGTNYFSDPQWTNYPERFYRAARVFTVGGTLTGLPAGDTVTLQDNGSDNLTLSANGPFTFPTTLPNGHAYSITVSGIFFGGLTATTCTLTNGRGTISGANVTNVAAQCAYNPETCPVLTGNPDVDMLNAAVSDGTSNGGVPGVMYTENGGPFLVTAIGPCTHRVALFYPGWAVFTQVVGTYSCSSTTFTNGTPVIQFGTSLACQPDDLYGY